MRRTLAAGRAVLFAALTALAAAPERLELLSMSARTNGGAIRCAFDRPADPAARDLREAEVRVRIDDEPATLLAAETPRLRVSRAGTKARWRAPRSWSSRIRTFRLSTASGSFQAKLGGPRLDPRNPPRIELAFADRVYVFEPSAAAPVPGPAPGPAPQPGPGAGLPEGPLPLTEVAFGPANLSATVSSRAIRSPAELAAFLAVATPYAADAGAMQQTDFSREMLLVAVGENLLQQFRPWKAVIRSVDVQSGRVRVAYDRYWGPFMGVREPSPTGPAYVAGFHAVRVPAGSEPVDFVATSVKSQVPWY